MSDGERDRPASAYGATMAIELLIVLCLVALVLSIYPRPGGISDEANFVATAYKMQREGKLTAATHDPVDVLAGGLDHKHVKMPAYFLVLAGWLAIVPDPSWVRVLNLTCYALAIWLLWRFVASQAAHDREGVLVLAAVTLAALPLGLAHANTAMSESWLFLVGVLHFLSWFALADRSDRLVWFLVSGFLAFISKESYAFLTLGIVLANPRAFVAAHVALWKRSPAALVGYLLLLGVLAAVALELFRDRGYYPNFRTQLTTAPTLSVALERLWAHAANNAKWLGRFRDFPNDFVRVFNWSMVALALTLAIVNRRRPEAGLYRAIVVYCLINQAFVLLLYTNQHLRGARIYASCELLTIVACFLMLVRADIPRRRALAYGAAMAIVTVTFAVPVNAWFINGRTDFSADRHLLTRRELPRPGDCLLSAFDFEFLDENPRCELIFRVPNDPAQTQAMVDRVRPRFVILPDGYPWNPQGYREVGRVPPARKAVAGPRTQEQIAWIRDEGSPAGDSGP